MKILSGADLSNQQIKNVAEPTDITDAATKAYVDNAIDQAVIDGGGTVLTNYSEITELAGYPTAFPTSSAAITDATETGRALITAIDNQALQDAVGLNQVDNTSDMEKPVSAAQQAALDLKANATNPTFAGTVTGITKAHVGLDQVDNTSDANKPLSLAATAALVSKADTSTVSSLDTRVAALESTSAAGFLVISDVEQVVEGTPAWTPIIRIQTV